MAQKSSGRGLRPERHRRNDRSGLGRESGFLEYPIALTNTLNVPRVANGVISWMLRQYPGIGITDDTLTPVVAECDDGRLNDIQGRHVSEADVMQALDKRSSGAVTEGSVGAGTGMISYGLRAASARPPGDFLLPAEALRSGCWSTPTMAVDLNSPWAECRSVGSMRLSLRSRRPFHLEKRRLDHRHHCHRCSAGRSAINSPGKTGRTGTRPDRLDGSPWERGFHAGILHRQCHSPLPDRADISPHASCRHPSESVITATVEATEEAILNALTMATTVVGATAIASRPFPSPDSVRSSITRLSNCG